MTAMSQLKLSISRPQVGQLGSCDPTSVLDDAADQLEATFTECHQIGDPSLADEVDEFVGGRFGRIDDDVEFDPRQSGLEARLFDTCHRPGHAETARGMTGQHVDTVAVRDGDEQIGVFDPGL